MSNQWPPWFFFLFLFKEVWRWKPAEGRWVRLLAWVWAGQWGVKGWCVWAFSTCWLNMTQPGRPRDLQSCTFWCTGVHAIMIWTFAVSSLPPGHRRSGISGNYISFWHKNGRKLKLRIIYIILFKIQYWFSNWKSIIVSFSGKNFSSVHFLCENSYIYCFYSV